MDMRNYAQAYNVVRDAKSEGDLPAHPMVEMVLDNIAAQVAAKMKQRR